MPVVPEFRDLLAAISAESDRQKKLVGLKVLSLLRKEADFERGGEGVIGRIASQLGNVAGEHARFLLRNVGLA